MAACRAPLLSLLFLLACLAQPRLGAADKILLGHLPVTGHAKFYVACEEGFFAAEGLDVELIDFSNSADGLSALNSGKLDLGAFGTVAPLVYIAAGADIRILAGVMGEDGFLVMTPENAAGFTGIKDLKGMTIATVRLSSGDSVLRDALRTAGLSWQADLNILELSSPTAIIDVVKNGQVDAGLTWGPHHLVAENQGLEVVLATADLFPEHPCCRLVARGDRFQLKKSLWQRFLRAFLKAERFTQDPAKRNDTIDHIGKYLDLPRHMIEESYYRGRLDQASDPNIQGVEKIWDILRATGLIHSDYQVRRRIETGPFLKALESLISEEPDEAYWRKVEALFLQRNIPPAADKSEPVK